MTKQSEKWSSALFHRCPPRRCACFGRSAAAAAPVPISSPRIQIQIKPTNQPPQIKSSPSQTAGAPPTKKLQTPGRTRPNQSMWMEQAKRARIQDGAGINVEAVLLLLLDQNQDLCLVVGFSSAKKKKIRAAGMEGLVVNSSASWSFEGEVKMAFFGGRLLATESSVRLKRAGGMTACLLLCVR